MMPLLVFPGKIKRFLYFKKRQGAPTNIIRVSAPPYTCVSRNRSIIIFHNSVTRIKLPYHIFVVKIPIIISNKPSFYILFLPGGVPDNSLSIFDCLAKSSPILQRDLYSMRKCWRRKGIDWKLLPYPIYSQSIPLSQPTLYYS